ncbi:MAG: glycosyltransferase family 2 protein [Candidatus Nanopelagicales bacterium]
MTADQGRRGLPVPQWWRSLVAWARSLVVSPAELVGRILLRDRPEPTREVWTESGRLWMPPNKEIEISVVMPAYNPGAGLRPAVDRLVSVMREAGVGFEAIVVNDGSTDGSMATLEGAGPEVRIVELPANRGKGGALHAGFSRARGSWVGFVDSDGDIDPAHLVRYLEVGRATGADMVYANKKHRESISASSPFRKVVSLGFSTLVSTLFTLGVNDTQTGCKLLRREVLADVLPRLRETRFAFDLELFVAASTAGYTTAIAAPVELQERMSGSSVTKSTILRTLKDALVVLARRESTQTYDRAVRPQAQVYARGVGKPRGGSGSSGNPAA